MAWQRVVDFKLKSCTIPQMPPSDCAHLRAPARGFTCHAVAEPCYACAVRTSSSGGPQCRCAGPLPPRSAVL